MTLVDQHNDREIYDFVRPEDFPVLRYSLAEATIDDVICHLTNLNGITQRKENLRVKYQRLSKLVVAQNVEAISAEADTRQQAYSDYFDSQEIAVDNPFEDLTLNMSIPVAFHLIQEEQVIYKAVKDALFG